MTEIPKPAGVDVAGERVAGAASTPAPATLPHCKRPCVECPWRISNKPGKFPRERYRHLAESSRDLSIVIFACHMSREGGEVACAGWLRSLDAQHNLAVRLARLDLRTIQTDAPLYASYYRLARANGVAASDPALSILRRDCR